MLLTEVFKHLGLDESDYFGLQYLDKKEQVVGSVTEEKQKSPPPDLSIMSQASYVIGLFLFCIFPNTEVCVCI